MQRTTSTMSRVTLALLVAIAVLFSTVNSRPQFSQQCPPNQEFTTCASACPGTCYEPNPRYCTLQCVIGCQCTPGLLRNNAGQCVRRERC